jgi:hypothetical protein
MTPDRRARAPGGGGAGGWRCRLVAARRAQPRRVAEPAAERPRWSPADAPNPLRRAPSRARCPAASVPRLDALIDAIAPLALEAPSPAMLALAHLPPTRRAGSKPFCRRRPGTRPASGSRPRPASATASCRPACNWPTAAGAQRDRVLRVRAEGAGLRRRRGAMPDFPDMLEVVARARELDSSPAPHDAQLSGHAARRGRLEVGLCSSTRRAWVSCRVWCRAGWCCRRRGGRAARCWCCPSTRRPRWPKTRNQARCANAR